MPAHIGFAGLVKASAMFVVTNTSPKAMYKQSRELHGGHVSIAAWKAEIEAKRARREMAFGTYVSLRERLDRYNPEAPGGLWVEQSEWDLYLKPGTYLDITCRHYYEVFRNMRIMLISERSDLGKLKRIEAHPEREKMRILWTAA